MTRTCSIDGCDKPHRARGWCSRHWTHWRRYGEPIAPGVVDTGAPPAEVIGDIRAALDAAKTTHHQREAEKAAREARKS